MNDAGLGSKLKYMNIILTVLLIVLAAGGIVMTVMLARLGKQTENTGIALQDISEDITSLEDNLFTISDTVDDIREQKGLSASEPDDPYDPYDPRFTMEVDKPVIYLYGNEDKTEAHVELVLKDADMLTVWPEAFNKGNVYSWDVYADRDGTITDKDGFEYSYLFWEAGDYGAYSFDEGFCVAGCETAEFLRSTLKDIGLSDKEANEFIVYWLPRMQDNKYNLISFKGLDPSDRYNTDFELKVTDGDGNNADSMLRVMMAWKAVDEAVEIEPQSFAGFERNGFTVVEWGGSEVK